jgi:hypothetical protein
MANLEKMLYDWLQIAENNINLNLIKRKENLKIEFYKNSWISKLFNEKEKFEKKLENIKKEIEKLDYKLSEKEKEESKVTWRNAKKSDLYVLRKIEKEKEYINQKNFISIRKKFEQAMWLACWVKEQRWVLFEFYKLNWIQLWIELPIDINIWEINIKNWKINIKNKLLENKK